MKNSRLLSYSTNQVYDYKIVHIMWERCFASSEDQLR